MPKKAADTLSQFAPARGAGGHSAWSDAEKAMGQGEEQWLS
jgi:hypothetical protein